MGPILNLVEEVIIPDNDIMNDAHKSIRRTLTFIKNGDIGPSDDGEVVFKRYLDEEGPLYVPTIVSDSLKKDWENAKETDLVEKVKKSFWGFRKLNDAKNFKEDSKFYHNIIHNEKTYKFQGIKKGR